MRLDRKECKIALRCINIRIRELESYVVDNQLDVHHFHLELEVLNKIEDELAREFAREVTNIVSLA